MTESNEGWRTGPGGQARWFAGAQPAGKQLALRLLQSPRLAARGGLCQALLAGPGAGLGPGRGGCQPEHSARPRAASSISFLKGG